MAEIINRENQFIKRNNTFGLIILEVSVWDILPHCFGAVVRQPITVEPVAGPNCPPHHGKGEKPEKCVIIGHTSNDSKTPCPLEPTSWQCPYLPIVLPWAGGFSWTFNIQTTSGEEPSADNGRLANQHRRLDGEALLSATWECIALIFKLKCSSTQPHTSRHQIACHKLDS